MGHFSGTETYWDGYSAWPFFIPKEPHQSQQRTRKVAYFFTLKRTKTGRRNGLLPKPNWTTYIRSDTIVQIGCRVDRMRCSGHRHMSFGEMWKLSRKVTGGGRPLFPGAHHQQALHHTKGRNPHHQQALHHTKGRNPRRRKHSALAATIASPVGQRRDPIHAEPSSMNGGF